jgi:beta-mannosidase
VTPADHERDIALAKDAGLDLVRVHTHISSPALYDAADRAGMLLWQDLPMHRGYHRSVRRQAVRQAREAVDLLAHHPSLAVWCGHNAPVATTIDPERLGTAAAKRRLAIAQLAGQELPTYNRAVLDRSVSRTLRRNDPSRPVVAHSGVLPNLPSLEGTDTHLHLGWYSGEEWQLPGLAAAMPSLVRFVGEFGAQSVPVDATFVDGTTWPDLKWDELAERYGAQLPLFERHVPPADYETFEEWAAATRRYQAHLIRFTIETLRRLKYRPTGGFALFSFADAMPAVSWSVLSADRVPKEGYLALKEVCAPVIVTADRLPDHVHPGEPVSARIHVVSDLREALDAIRIVARWTWDGGEATQGFAGTVEADSCVLVGTTTVDAPESDGPLCLTLELHLDGEVTRREDRTVVVGGAHSH